MLPSRKRPKSMASGSPTASIMTNGSDSPDSKDSQTLVQAAAAAACSLTFIPACFVCKSLFKEGTPIFQCGTSIHLACLECWKISSRPWCECMPQASTRSTTLESLVLPAIKTPCSNAMHGCHQILSYYSREAHQRDACEYSPVKCAVSACSFSGHADTFLVHLRDIHGIVTIDAADGKRVHLSLSITANLTPIRVSIQGTSRSVVCLLHQELVEQGDMSAFFMTHLGPSLDEEHKMIYEIAVGRPPNSIDCLSLRSWLMSHSRATASPPPSPPPLRLYISHAAASSDDSVKIIVCVKKA